MADTFESLEIVEEIGDNVGLLLDYHLKVFCAIHGLCKYEFLEATKRTYLCLYISDNDGITDSNLPVRADSGFGIIYAKTSIITVWRSTA